MTHVYKKGNCEADRLTSTTATSTNCCLVERTCREYSETRLQGHDSYFFLYVYELVIILDHELFFYWDIFPLDFFL